MLLLYGLVFWAATNLVQAEIMEPEAPATPKQNIVKVEMYIESQCPYCTSFIHNSLKKAWTMLSPTGRVEFTVVPVGTCAEKGDDFECFCQHGKDECLLNQLMNCVIEQLGHQDKILPSIHCIEGRRNLTDAMKSCIANNALLNEEQMHTCATGPHGRRLLAMAGMRTKAVNPPIYKVPWIVIDGRRNANAFHDLTKELCLALRPPPEVCIPILDNSERNGCKLSPLIFPNLPIQ